MGVVLESDGAILIDVGIAGRTAWTPTTDHDDEIKKTTALSWFKSSGHGGEVFKGPRKWKWPAAAAQGAALGAAQGAASGWTLKASSTGINSPFGARV